jgi:hypothetical protein
MPKKANVNLTLATYSERIEPQVRAVKLRHVHDTIRHLENAEGKLVEGGKAFVASVEEMRLAGVSWLAGSDKNQYDLYFYDWMETLVKPEQRKILNKEVVKTAIHFANVIKEPIEDLQTALPFVQKVGMAFAALRKKTRGIEDVHIPASEFAEFESSIKTLCVKLRKLEQQCPLESMDETALDVIIKEGQQVYEFVDKAIKLRKQKLIVV